MNHIVTLLAALLGSGLLSTLLTYTMNRHRHDRHVELMETWKAEADLLRDLEENADLSTSEKTDQPRNLALATAARTQINAAIARRLIPSTNLRFWGYFSFGILLGLIGALTFFSGIFYAISYTKMLKIFFIFVAFVGLSFLLIGSFFYLLAWTQDMSLSIMRAKIHQSLNGESLNIKTTADLFPRKSSKAKPELKKRYKTAVPAEVRQAFDYFMQNVKTESTQSTEANSSR